jgi:HEAT repeat protein/beta-lactamase regulating signal transducer with metallopeptidase domain
MSLLQSVGWALVHFVWQGIAIAAVLAIALAAARRAPATFRYALSTGALLLMFVVPVGTTLRLHGTAQPVAEPVVVIDANPGELVKPTELKAETATPRTEAADPTRGAAVDLSAVRVWLELHMHWLVALWTLGVVALSIRLLGGWLRARQLRTQGTAAVPDAWQQTLFRLAQRLGVAVRVEILESALVAMPVVIGWLRPVILLPGSVFTGLTTQQLEAILAHELAHIRRHDYLVNLAQSVIETVLFYHPAVWWVSRRVRDEREHCCDDLAVSVCGDVTGYAAALVDMERLRGAALAYALGAGGGSLVMRVRRLVTPLAPAETAPRWAAGAVAVVAALVVGGASGVPAAVAENTSEPARQAAQRPDTVLKHPDPAAPLAERWEWAEREASKLTATTYWIGYTVTPPAAVDRLVYIDSKSVVYGDHISMSGRMFGDFRGLRFPGVAIEPFVGAHDPAQVKLLLEFRGARGAARLARVHASSFPLPVELGGQPLIWLGAGHDAASLPLLERLYAGAATLDLKEQVLDGIAIHGTSALVVPALARRLAPAEPAKIRASAAELLAMHPTPAAIALLARAARSDASGEVRREAAEAYGEMDLPAATDTLIALARSLEDAEARREAVEALGEQQNPKARAALEAIAREDRRTDVRREALESLGQSVGTGDAVAILTEAARSDPSPDVQREAVETLGEIGTEQARAAVMVLARTHPHPDVRREAMETLGEAWPSDDTVELLARLARDDANPDVQREAVETLGEIGNGLGIGAVVEIATTHPHPDVRREALETVTEHLAPPEALRVLRDALRNDPSEDVRRDAVETLGELHTAEALALLVDVARTHGDQELRREAVETIGEAIAPAEAVTILKAILNEDRSVDVQREALETLMELPGGAGIPAVIAAARGHQSRELRIEALKALAESDDARARSMFERALGTP